MTLRNIASAIKPITGSRSWEEFVALGLQAREHGDESRWELGDLANELDQKYGEGAIESWGKEIGLRRSTAYEYKKVAGFYPQPDRNHFIEANPMVTYSHFRMATRLGDINHAWTFLADCSSDGWTVEQAERELVGQPGQRGWRMKTIYKGLAKVDWDDYTSRFYVAPDNVDVLRNLTVGDQVEIVIKMKEEVKREVIEP